MYLKFLSFFRKKLNAIIANNPKLKFFLFMEDDPKHKVMQNINLVLLAFFGVLNFVVGASAFFVFACFGLPVFMAYYVGMMVTAIEVLHYIYDR